MGMDRLSLLANAVTQPDHAMHHPLAGVGHPAHFPPPSSSSHLGTAAPPPHLVSHHSGPYGYHAALLSQSPDSPDSAPHHHELAGLSNGGAIANGGSKKKAARQMSQQGDDDGEGRDADGQPLRKRTKQSLSCGECKRRKIKCDRKVPCTACLKRGDGEACNWEDAKIEPEKQPFALAAETDDLRARLSLIERFINKLPDPLKTTFKELGISQMGDLPRQELRKAEVDFGAQFGSSARQLPADKPVAPPDSLGLMDSLLFSGPKTLGVEGLQQPDHPDLTSMLTSIVAPRVVYTNPSVSSNLGLDPCFSQEELDAERLRLLDKVYAQLPNKRDCDVAIDRYFDQFDWFFSILHHATWRAEYSRFWEMLELGRKYEVDPAWLSILYLLLALSSDESMHLACPSTPEESSAWEEQSARYHACAQKLALLADPFGRPQARMIQITTFLACWTLISAHGGEFGRFSSWLAGGIRTAQKMGLHQLSDDQEDMPPDDPAWPPGKNALKRETALRLWGFLSFFDHLSASARFKGYMIHPSHTTTPPLSNVNWQNLTPHEWKISPAPRSVLTDSSMEYHKLRLSQVSRKTFDLLIATASSDSFNYGTILELDKDYRNLLDSLPDVWLHECAALEHADPTVRNKRYIAMQGTHNRLVRLHRPFLVKGWEPNSRFAYSSDACVRSARAVVLSHHNNIDFNRNLRTMYSHTLSAAIVLGADLYHAIDGGAADAEIESKKSTFALSLEIFGRDIQDKVASRHLRVIIEAGRRVLTGLFAEQVQRRARIGARRAAGDDASSERSFAEILQSFAREMDLAPTPSVVPVGLVPACDQGHYEIPTLATAFSSTDAPATSAASSSRLPEPDLSVWNPGPPQASIAVPLPSDFGGSFQVSLMQDMGLMNTGGQTWDYWTQNGGEGTPQPSSGGGGGGGRGGGSSGYVSQDGPSLDLSAFLGGGAPVNTQDAAQVLLNQLTGGW